MGDAVRAAILATADSALRFHMEEAGVSAAVQQKIYSQGFCTLEAIKAAGGVVQAAAQQAWCNCKVSNWLTSRASQTATEQPRQSTKAPPAGTHQQPHLKKPRPTRQRKHNNPKGGKQHLRIHAESKNITQ